MSPADVDSIHQMGALLLVILIGLPLGLMVIMAVHALCVGRRQRLIERRLMANSERRRRQS